MSVRVRFAPSPTGPLHIGGVRTALYNYLFAKSRQGTFIVRIEDTDQKRYVDGAEAYIIESLEWLGLLPTESPFHGGEYGPYRQSERGDMYNTYVDQLLASGKAYYAFDTPEQLAAMRTEKEALGVHSPKYGHQFRMEMNNSLTMSKEDVASLIKEKTPFVVRLKVEPGHNISFEDEVRGSVQFSSDELDDKVLLKSDGLPTYHLANVVDDHLMKITHVIRGEEWLSSTPIHVLLYRAFDWDDSLPIFVHLPLILKPSGKGKLSKRDGAKFGFPVFPLEWNEDDDHFLGFRELGFLPEAVINFLAFLGWNPGTDEEIMDLNTLSKLFSLEKINKSGARFDIEKAYWYNQQYILQTQDEIILELLKSTQNFNFENHSDVKLIQVINLMKPRIRSLNELLKDGYFFFEKPTELDVKMLRKKWKSPAIESWSGIIKIISGVEDFVAETIQNGVKEFMSNNELSFGAIFPLIRIAVSGTVKGPDLFQTMEVLGKKETIERLTNAPSQFEEVIGSHIT